MSTHNNILCDNMGAIHTFQHMSKHIPSGAKNNDVKCFLQRVQSRRKSLHLHHHVKVHQDDHAYRSHQSLEEKLNWPCNNLAKAAIIEGVLNGVEIIQ